MKFTFSGAAIGLLVGIGLYAVLTPETTAGTALLFLIALLACSALGTAVDRFKRRK
jgi:hypothetical protein